MITVQQISYTQYNQRHVMQGREKRGQKDIPLINSIDNASVENLKSFCASIATYGGTALFHMEGITPEAEIMARPKFSELITSENIEDVINWNCNDSWNIS